MLIRRIQSSGWFSESIMRFEIPWISIVIIQARTSCYLVTHGCLSILSRTQREGQGKNISKRYDNGKIEQNIFARCFVHKYQVLPQTACTWVWNVGTHCHFLCLKPMKQHPKTRERTSLFPHTSLKVNFIITLFLCVCSKPAFFFFFFWPLPCAGKGPVICVAECDKYLLWNMCSALLDRDTFSTAERTGQSVSFFIFY